MRKSLLLTICLSIVAILVVSLGITYGWFINSTSTDSIDATTKGIVFSYTINDGNTKKEDVSVFDVKNITFFDMDGAKEGTYFANMACCLTLTYSNICDSNISIELTYKSSSNNEAYICGLITTNIIESSSEYDTVNDVIEAFKVGDAMDSYTIPLIEPEDKITVYLYLFGIQPDDSASNSFFNGVYGFTLTSKAVKEVE